MENPSEGRCTEKAVEKWKGGMEIHFYSKSENSNYPLTSFVRERGIGGEDEGPADTAQVCWPAPAFQVCH